MLRHALTAIVIAIVLRWLYGAAAKEKPGFESGLTKFAPSKAVKALMGICVVGFGAAAIASAYALSGKPGWWASLLFLGFALLGAVGMPPVITIDDRGVTSTHWFGKTTCIPWNEITSLEYNIANKTFTVRSKSSKIQHTGFHIGSQQFRDAVQRRTKLPMKMKSPGTWRSNVTEIPYTEN